MAEPMDSPIVQALRALQGGRLFPQAPPPSQPVNAPFSPPASSWAEVQADPLKALANLVMGAVDPWGQPKGLNTGSIGGILGAALPLASLARGTEAGIAARGTQAAHGAEEAVQTGMTRTDDAAQILKGLLGRRQPQLSDTRLSGYHGSETALETLRGDKAGVAYIAEDVPIARDYAGWNGVVHKVTTPKTKPLHLGDDPYNFNRLRRAVTSPEAEAAVERYAAPDEDGIRHGVFTAMRDPVIVKDLRASGYDAVQFADDHDWTRKPLVWALLEPENATIVSRRPSQPALRELREQTIRAFRKRP